MNYGVQKIVAINSGKYLLAEVDVSKPVHLAADNNRGKSTLVNTLQFLYVDDFAKMRFGRRNLEDTKRHYFGTDRSYLVFECQTPSGIQCMLIRGLGALSGGRFERFLYDGAFMRDDYIDGEGGIREFQAIRTRLAGRHLSQVKNAELWRVLSVNAPNGEGKQAPRLGILPIRKHEEYEAFREVFAKLLSLSAADARVLKHLIIDSHARDLAERRIDIALDYREDFERVERSERELAFIQAISAQIVEGRDRRLELRQLRETFEQVAPEASRGTRECFSCFEIEQERLDERRNDLEDERREFERLKELNSVNLGILQEKVRQAEEEIQALEQKHAKWGQYSPEFIAEMKRNVKAKTVAIGQLSESLEQAARFDLQVLKQQARELEDRITSDQLAFSEWESTAAAELLRAGVTSAELRNAFRVARPELLKLVVGKSITLKNVDAISKRVRELAARVKEGKYSDIAVRADLTSITPPDESYWQDRSKLRKQIDVNQESLRQQQGRLAAAEDTKNAKRRLKDLETECEDQRRQLNEHEDYVVQWSKRENLKSHKRELSAELKVQERRIAELKSKLLEKTEAVGKIDEERRSLGELRRSLTTASQQFHEHLRGVLPEYAETSPVEGGKPPKSLTSHVQKLVTQLGELTQQAKLIRRREDEVRDLQSLIHEQSLELKAGVCYFGDAEAEWARLIENYESLPQRESANQKNWDALLKTLGARINGIVMAMRSIKQAVEGINRGLKTYQVSNLRAVEISAEVVHDIYSALEALTGSDGLFADRDAIDAAKRKLRTMIDTAQVIELPALFEIHIRTQLPDGTWQNAASLDEVGSTGTGMTTKAMIFIQLVRAIATNERYRLHFYIDGLGELDDRNLSATAEMAISKGIIPITADPRLHFEPLAHPEVTIYSLGQNTEGRFYIDSYRTYRARRLHAPVAHTGGTNE